MATSFKSHSIRLACMALFAATSLTQAASLGTVDGRPVGYLNGVGDSILYTGDMFGMPITLPPINLTYGALSVHLNDGTATGGAVDIYNLGTPSGSGYNALVGWNASLAAPIYTVSTLNTTDDLSTHSPDNPMGFGFLPAIGTASADTLGKLFYLYEENARNDSNSAAAFQLAIYEILYETSGTYDLLSGDLKLGSTVWVNPTMANGMLSSLVGATDIAGLYLLDSTAPGTTNTIVSDGAHLEAPIAAVPEPITLASLGICILGAGGYIRRRTKA